MHKVVKVSILLVSILMVAIWIYFSYLIVFATKSDHHKLSKENDSKIIKERTTALEEADKLFKQYYYDEAIQRLSDKKINNNIVRNKIKEYQTAKNNLVKYEGLVEHIFFHSLVIYPERAYKNFTTPTFEYNTDFAYQTEFKKMLPQLLDRGYILFSINDVYGKDINGNMTRKDIYLPAGKKPLILSEDDVFYQYGNAFANRLVIDEHDEVATLVTDLDNKQVITRDGDIVPIVDDFVKEHPEFSYHGGKGILALTGFKGIYGYNLDKPEEVVQAKMIADKLKDNGWLFASHSYTHNRNGYWSSNGTYDHIKYDVTKWLSTVGQVVGPTNIFIAPFGYVLPSSRMSIITDNGFDIYCSVDSTEKETIKNDLVIMSRIEMSAYSMIHYKKYLNDHYFNVDEVFDSHRPPIS